MVKLTLTAAEIDAKVAKVVTAKALARLGAWIWVYGGIEQAERYANDRQG